MIAHVNIMLQIIAMLTGVWIIFYSYYMYKSFGHSFIRKLVLISLFINLWLLLSFTSKYINLNVTYFYSTSKISWGYIVRHPLSSLAFSAAFLTLLSVAMEFSGIKIFANAEGILRKIFIIIVISYIGGFILYAYDPNAGWLEYIDIVLITGGNVLVYISLVLLMLVNRYKDEKNFAIRMFSVIYGLVFLPIAAFMFMIPLKFTVISGLFILANAAPFVWLKWIFAGYYVDPLIYESGNGTLERIAEEYKLTNREIEIMKLILQGKSNKEIKSELFISLNTVRNHTHNLYKKLDVNGRGQMVGLILISNKKAF